MRLFKSFQLFKESNFLKPHVQNDIEKPKSIYKPTNLVSEICVSMTLLNNQFLDNILDRGLKARYSENTQVFLTDLKNLFLAKNRLCLGKLQDDKFIEDSDVSKINGLFEATYFSIEEDWSVLSNARTTARNIIDKLLMTEKLEDRLINRIYWIGPNKSKEVQEDIVIETTDGKQYGFYLNKNLSTSKTSSFMALADDLIGKEVESLYNDEFQKKWNKLVQNWVRIIYENCNPTFQAYFEKFIEPSRIQDIKWFDYFDIKHKDPQFKNLGEHFKEFDKNIVYFSDFINEVWKNKENHMVSYEKAEEEWNEKKIFLLNSKIIEHLLTQSIIKNNKSDVKKLSDGFKISSGNIKMKLLKNIVEKLGSIERDVYFLGKNVESFYVLPSRGFFREFYDNINVKFDYHVKIMKSEEMEDNNFKINIKVELDEEHLMDCIIIVKFTGSELSSKLSATYKFEPTSKFNYLVIEKMKKSEE